MNADLAKLADWRSLYLLLFLYLASVTGLIVYGRGKVTADPRTLARRIADGLERLTGVPGWAAAMVGTASFGVLVAGQGFYNDVRWHVSLGRDKALFTAPHTAIVIGLMTIFASALIGEFFATSTKANVGLRLWGMRIPYSAIAMGLLGSCALAGFPLDDLWHKQYGIDVTMWSPTHLLMIVGAGLSPIASWLALGEAGVRPGKKWGTGLHIAVGALTLLGLSAMQGEFAFGVPQFQQLYHPVLYALAAGFALSAIAVVARRWWALLVVAGVGMILGTGDGLLQRSSNGSPRSASLFVVAALAVALVSRLLGVERRMRFAVATGFAIGTVGLAGEWLWSQGGYQPWNGSLLPQAPIYATVVGIAAAVLGVAFGAAIRKEPSGIGVAPLVVAGVALLVAFALPLPRPGLDASAKVHVIPAAGGVRIRAQVTPVDAASNAHWFQAMAWQGDGFRVADMKATGKAGEYLSDGVVPVSGKWKTMLRLHTGASMVSIPIWMPADAEIGKPAIQAVDKDAPFLTEQRYLLREQHAGPAWFSIGIYIVLAGIAALWMGAFVLAARKVRPVAGVPASAGALAHV